MLGLRFEEWLALKNVKYDADKIVFMCSNDRSTSSLDDNKAKKKKNWKVLVRTDINLRAGDVILNIPFDACFSHLTALLPQKTKNEKVKSMLRTSDWLARLTICLVYELKNLNESDFGPYLEHLPIEESEVISNWTAFEKEILLKGTDFFQLFGYLRDETEAAKEEFAMFKDAFSDDLNFKFTIEDYVRARTVCSSRAFEIKPKVVGLMPLADLFNHHSSGNHVNVTEGYKESSVAVVVLKSCGNGEEIFNTYGKLSNTDLLNSYGFCEEEEEIANRINSPRFSGLDVRQKLLLARECPDEFKKDSSLFTIDDLKKIFCGRRDDIIRSIFLQRLRAYPDDEAFEKASKDIRLKKERVELARLVRKSEMNAIAEALKTLASKQVLQADLDSDMFSLFT